MSHRLGVVDVTAEDQAEGAVGSLLQVPEAAVADVVRAANGQKWALGTGVCSL